MVYSLEFVFGFQIALVKMDCSGKETNLASNLFMAEKNYSGWLNQEAD